MDIPDLLRRLGLEQYEAVLRANAIKQTFICELTEDHLRELGLPIGARLTLLKYIAAIREHGEATALLADISSDGLHPHIAERRQVTVMFADLVGSTALSALMDPEDLRELLGTYYECAAQTIRQFDGFLARTFGDGVLVYFGYPRAHEDDAERAVRAGLQLIPAVAGLKSGAPLQIRVGIASGLVVVGDLIQTGGALECGIFGETPNLAARLQGIAEPNTVVLADGTRKQIGNLFELRDLGSIELKGIPKPVRTWAALRASSVPSRFEALHGSGLTAFVGRENEFEVLERGLDKARSQLCVIDLVAEPGMGKSRLLHEFRGQIADKSVFVLLGNCSPDGNKTAFCPFLDVVRGSFRINPGESEAGIAQKLETGLTALGLNCPRNVGLLLHLLGLTVLNGTLTGLDGVLIGLRTRELLEELLEALCRLSPVVMVIEDLQWIDSVSEDLLRKIVDSKHTLRLLLLHTRRPEYLPGWLDGAAVIKLSLEPLLPDHISRLVRNRLGRDVLPEVLAEQVVKKADGNPLFAEEIVTFLTERGILHIIEDKLEFDARVASEVLPSNLQSLLTARVDSLPPKDRALLQAASVIGRQFDPDLLARVVGDPEELEGRLTGMQSLDLIRPDGRSHDYLFKHSLVRDALYQSLLSRGRRSLHLKVAEEIERGGGNRLAEVAEVLAHHYSQSDHHNKAFTYLAMAGHKCLSVYSLDEAANHFAAALSLLEKNPNCAVDDEVAEFLVSYALLLNMSALWKILIRILEQHLPRIDCLGDDPRLVLIRHHHVIALLYNARYREAAALQRETFLMAERLGNSKLRAYALAGDLFVSSIVSAKPLNEFETLKREAIKAISEPLDAYIRNWVRFVIGQEEFHRGRINEARLSARELMEIGREMKDPRSTGLGLSLLTIIALVSDSYAEALEYSEQALAGAVTPLDRSIAIGGKGTALVLLRRTEEGAKLFSDYRRRCIANGEIYAQATCDVMTAVSKVLQGNIRTGIRMIEQEIQRQERQGYSAAADWYCGFLAEVYLQILAKNTKMSLPKLLKNLPIIVKLTLTASSRIRLLMTRILENPRYDREGLHVGRAQMILGLLYKIKKRHGLAIQHLTEARRIVSQFGQSPMLARINSALATM
jgi:class 3 adenylate cyclase